MTGRVMTREGFDREGFDRGGYSREGFDLEPLFLASFLKITKFFRKSLGFYGNP